MSTNDQNLLLPMTGKLLRHSVLTQEEQEALLDLPVSLRTAERASYLIRQEEAEPNVMVILDGFAYCSKIAGDGGRQILSFHLAGDMINLQGSLLGRADYSVQALTAVQVGYIRSSALMKLAAVHPGIAAALWRDTSIDSSVAIEWMLNVGRRDARQRIAHLICEFARRQQAAGVSDGPTYQWPLTQIEVADATGLTNVHVNRMLQDLQRQRLLRVDRRSATILDWTALTRVADFDGTYLHQDRLSLPLRNVVKLNSQAVLSMRA